MARALLAVFISWFLNGGRLHGGMQIFVKTLLAKTLPVAVFISGLNGARLKRSVRMLFASFGPCKVFSQQPAGRGVKIMP